MKSLLIAAVAAPIFALGAWQSSPSSAAVKKEVVKLPAKVTYAEHIAPIVNDHCAPCHHPGAVAPFSLVGFENTKKQAANIVSATGDKRMPPWKATHGYGEFRGENRLTETELALLKKWSDTGASRGDASKEPQAPKFAEGWQIGKPDLVLSPSKPYKLEAEGEDVYRNFVFDLGNKEPVYIKGMDVRPSNKQVVHHVIAYLDSSGRSSQLEARANDGQEGYTSSGGGIGITPSGALGGWAPGVAPIMSDKGTAFVIEPGTKVVVQVHYHKSGKPESDKTQLGLYTTTEKPERALDIYWAANPMFRIPAGAKAHKVSWSEKIPTDATMYSVMPHMHLLGKSMKAHLTLPDGKDIPLVLVEDWDFNWQLMYRLKEPLFVPKGSRLHVEAIYDNSTDNPNNPRSNPEPVTWGEQTTDEMALLVVVFSSGTPLSLKDQMKAKVQDRLEQMLKQRGGN